MDSMKFVAHKTKDGRRQPIYDHLQKTMQLAAEFAAVFGGETMAGQMGLGHDIGKYSKEFQKRILQNGKKVDHSTAGGIEVCKESLLGRIMAYGIMGHHGGLPDGGNRSDSAGDITLMGRKKRIPGEHICEYSAFAQEIHLEKDIMLPEILRRGSADGFTISFLIRMLFSCLVDADYQDTERFMAGHAVPRGCYEPLGALLAKLQEYIKPWWNPQTQINKKRCQILRNCIQKADSSKGIYTLTVPTGGGKTVASLAFALYHAQAQEKPMRRIIYVIPFTSIIEQNAAVFERILGEENVIAHHSNVSYDEAEWGSQGDEEINDSLNGRRRLAVENWDAPVIVTTNVQFFESLFSNKPGKSRKLHNIANSVIIFDEAQMLPLKYLKPCMRAITELVKNYHCTAVLCTATQPALEKFIPEELKSREICENTKELYDFFRRTTIEDLDNLTDAQLVAQLDEQPQVLCIVNSRRQAQNLYEKMADQANVFHLSTYMTPAHRKHVLRIIRGRLKYDNTCRVIATSLIEAGVDVDFPCVYRARAGLDSMIQAAGRANREGKRAADESFVFIFDAEKKYTDYYPAYINTGRSLEQEIKQYHSDIAAPEAIENYFNRLHRISGSELDEKEILPMLEKGVRQLSFPFKRIASEFRLIEQNTRMLMIPYSVRGSEWENRPEGIISRLRAGDINRALLREAGLYAVNLYERQYDELARSGQIEPIDEEMAILADESLYHEKTGLRIMVEEGKGLFL